MEIQTAEEEPQLARVTDIRSIPLEDLRTAPHILSNMVDALADAAPAVEELQMTRRVVKAMVESMKSSATPKAATRKMSHRRIVKGPQQTKVVKKAKKT